jgi:hypothetical protein
MAMAPGRPAGRRVVVSDLGLQRGSVALRSSGPITFGPDEVLFVADNATATIHAIDVGDTGAAAGAEPFDLEHVDERVASYLGAAVSDITISDLAVHPVTHGVYLSVQRGHGDDARAVLVRIDHLDGSVTDVDLTDVPTASVTLDDVERDTKIVGRTVAELGAMNQPLDMVSCTIGGEEHVLVANSSHGLIKIATRDIDDQPGLTEPREPVGVPREVEDLQGIVKLENLDGTHVLALQVDQDGGKHLRSLKTASL